MEYLDLEDVNRIAAGIEQHNLALARLSELLEERLRLRQHVEGQLRQWSVVPAVTPPTVMPRIFASMQDQRVRRTHQ